MHPPTAYCFCKHILFLLPQPAVPMETRYEILELARFLTELSVIDYYFVVHRSSDVALAALLNSMEAVTGSSDLATLGFEQELTSIAGGLDPHKKEVLECRDRLHVLYTQGGYSRPEIIGRETRDETVSPVCVSFGLAQQVQQYSRTSAPDSAQDDVLARDRNEEAYEIKVAVAAASDVHDLSKPTSPISNHTYFDQQHQSQELQPIDMMLFGTEGDDEW